MKKSSQAKVKPKSTSRSRGRPSKIKQINIEQLKFLISKGCTNEEICSFFKIDNSTFWRYQQNDPEFCNAIKGWKEFADERVERSLYERACGFSHKSEEIFHAFGVTTRVKTIKQYPPDTIACIIWLKNRQPEKWRENPPPAMDPRFENAELDFIGVPNQKDPAFEKKFREKYEQN